MPRENQQKIENNSGKWQQQQQSKEEEEIQHSNLPFKRIYKTLFFKYVVFFFVINVIFSFFFLNLSNKIIKNQNITTKKKPTQVNPKKKSKIVLLWKFQRSRNQMTT